MNHEPHAEGLGERTANPAEHIPRLIDALTKQHGDYGQGGRVEAVRQGLIDDLHTVQQQIELLRTKQAIAESNVRIDSDAVKQKQQQRNSRFLAENSELLAQHEGQIDALLRAIGIASMQLHSIAERLGRYEDIATRLQQKIEACEASHARFNEIALGQAALLLQALETLNDVETYVDDIDISDDDMFIGIVERPLSLAGDRIIVDIMTESMRERPLSPPVVSRSNHDDIPTELVQPVRVVIPPLRSDKLFGK